MRGRAQHQSRIPDRGAAVGAVPGNVLAQAAAPGQLYHLIEGHTLRPLIYGRALQLSALAVLISITLCTEVAGILGSLAAIPIAGSIQVIIIEVLEERQRRRSNSVPGPLQPSEAGA